MAWTTDKRACKALYFSLQRTEQIHLLTEFDDAGKLKMQDLLFFNMHNSADLRKQEAIILSSRLDSEFVSIYRARYEMDKDRAISIALITECLMEPDNTVEILSDTVDSCYKFRDEN